MHKIGKVYNTSPFCAYKITKTLLRSRHSFIGYDMLDRVVLRIEVILQERGIKSMAI